MSTAESAAQNAPAPHELWAQADREHPADRPGRLNRYMELMIQHGHVIVDPSPPEERAGRPALCMKGSRQGWLCTRPIDHEGDCE